MAEKTETVDFTGFASKVPRDVNLNVAARREIITKCDSDMDMRDHVLEMVKRDILTWINLFALTKDPKKPFTVIPFILYPAFQDQVVLDLVEAIKKGEDIGIEKTREMGVSWMVLYVFIWFWLFYPNSDFLVGSRKEAVVDTKGDPSTLFEKIRICLRNLPPWMLPDNFSLEDDALTMRILNPSNGNSIIGESANAYFGSGGRTKAILLDEHAKWDASISESAWTATADVTRCRIPVSTPVGAGNKFAVLMSGQTKIKKITVHWTQHPDKCKGAYLVQGSEKTPIPSGREFEYWLKYRDVKAAGMRGCVVRSEWYDFECERRTDQEIAQELDISYLMSGNMFFDPFSISKQRVWDKLVRTTSLGQTVPYGKYVEGKILYVDGKYKFLEGVPGSWIKIFEMPVGWLSYVLGGDTSEGLVKGDESFGVIRCRYTTNVMATIQGRYAPDLFAQYLVWAAKYFNDAVIGPEANNHGYSVCKDVETLGGNLHYEKALQSEPRRGLLTTNISRRTMLDASSEELRKLLTEVRDGKIISQMRTFVRNDKTGKPEADGSFLDDGVFGFTIAGELIKKYPFKPVREHGSISVEEVEQRRRQAKNGGMKF